MRGRDDERPDACTVKTTAGRVRERVLHEHSRPIDIIWAERLVFDGLFGFASREFVKCHSGVKSQFAPALYGLQVLSIWKGMG